MVDIEKLGVEHAYGGPVRDCHHWLISSRKEWLETPGVESRSPALNFSIYGCMTLDNMLDFSDPLLSVLKILYL